jgi:hypothetical protein
VKQLAAEDPTILDDQKRLLAAVRGEPLEPRAGWRVHNGRVNRDCISKTEYDRRMEERRAAGLLIDPSTAKIEWWYAMTLDHYNDGLPVLFDQVGREYFARAPDSDFCVHFLDLPKATRDAIWPPRYELAGAEDDDVPF